MNLLRFPELTRRGLSHFFTLRKFTPSQAVDLPELLRGGKLPLAMVSAEQVHGSGVVRVGRSDAGRVVPQVDALITSEKDLTLVVRVADCGPVWLHCSQTGAIGVVHSGRKGTELGIVPATIQAMRKEWGADPSYMIGLLGPCIRPPHYEVDFATEILRQLRQEGVGEVVDSSLCTASDPERFYSYRRDKGQTGRHFAVLSL